MPAKLEIGGNMIRVCYSKFHKGSQIFGEKPPYEDKSYTHGLCETCFDLEMEELERMGRISSDWREDYKEFKKNFDRRTKMPGRIRDKILTPRVGDFVLWEDQTWEIIKVKRKTVIIGLFEEPEKHELDREELLIDNLEPTPIKTWEVE